MSRRLVAYLLCSLLVVSGCVAVAPSRSDGGEGGRATVTRVIDGDTIAVRYPDGTTDTVRLLGVDSPELDGRNEPAEFEGVPDTEAGRRCLEGVAHESSAFARRTLDGASVEVVVDEAADRRDRYDRLLAYVVLSNGTDFNYRLVVAGHARVYDSTFARSERFYAAEAEARTARRGLWRCRDPASALGGSGSALGVAAVHADAEGSDHENLNDEFVVFRNVGNATLDLTGWTVSDETGRGYRFPGGFTLAPGATVTLYSGAGADSADALYWDSNGAVWNNDGDAVVVANASGSVVLRYRF